MPEGKNIVSDMDENCEMRTDAVTQASIAIQKYKTESEMAKHIKAFFDGKYDPNWMCVVGKDFASFGTYETKTYLFFYIGQIAVRIDVGHSSCFLCCNSCSTRNKLLLIYQ
ncbi:dynein light chain 1, putative [Perkinsus marinus ATCC 50983]|uniref:Dynein light chain n=1 Tax=Perkinsus marinus (strain ATCC 50983 / TXsc) TaxID=423536 RepID=C5KGV7_PERM5|nr:dynein light chain 1, putative [Perkinsus marinus ATCC 50983]EER16286.1 dynein light chain 1, putative [Perkinsus marinus ATCC 50983]|eukprot:XP_002784490.1 dynein light chain 1, putative [Perkinsus marinus ATCC 50983]